MAGKGSKPRPFSISKKEFDDRFDAINWKKKNDDYIQCEYCKCYYDKEVMKQHLDYCYRNFNKTVFGRNIDE